SWRWFTRKPKSIGDGAIRQYLLTVRRFSSYRLNMALSATSLSATALSATALSATALSATEYRILDAAKSCCERWGFAKVTIDDIAAESGVSRATLYRLFPGGKDVLVDALRVRELEEFFALL